MTKRTYYWVGCNSPVYPEDVRERRPKWIGASLTVRAYRRSEAAKEFDGFITKTGGRKVKQEIA